jgi:hypothetical protein
MDSARARESAVVAAAWLALAAAPLGGQDRPVMVGLGGGLSPLLADARDARVGRRHSLLTVGLVPARWRVELRGDLMWAHWPSNAGPVSATANVVVPVGSLSLGTATRVRPFVLVGAGVYGVGNPEPPMGANAGAGVRLEVSRLGGFVEVRRHMAYERTFLTFGLTWRP